MQKLLASFYRQQIRPRHLMVCRKNITFAEYNLWLMKFADKNEEWLPLVNEQGEVIGKAPRSKCHGASRLLHPVVHLHITDGHGGIFLQKRSRTKKLLPGKWDTAVGGHIGIGETPEEALHREAREELGIRQFTAQPLATYVWETERERELVYAFICREHDGIHIDNDEVEEGRFWTREEIRQGIETGDLTPNFIHEYQAFFA